MRLSSAWKSSVVLVVTLACGACDKGPVSPSPGSVSATDTSEVIGQMGVAFLNRFVASEVSPEACLVDFTDACPGKRDELSDIRYNRVHFDILGSRLGQPTVRIATTGVTANISIPCAFDSRAIKCDTPDCVVGSMGYVTGNCTLTSVRETAGWRLCTSNFSGIAVTPSAQFFFGPPIE